MALPHPGLGWEGEAGLGEKAVARADGDGAQDEGLAAPASPLGLVPL